MRLAFKKLFESGPNSAKTNQHSATIQEVESKTPSAAEGDAFWQGRDEDLALKYEKVSCNFDSIGQRNETLRARLETISRRCRSGHLERDRIFVNSDVEAYLAALASLHRQSRRMAAFHKVYDLVVSPTLAKPPVPLGVLRTDNDDLEAYRRELVAFMPFTQLFNMTGQPSMTVPLFWSAANVPIGVMFSAPFGGEATLFRIAGQLEAARPWFHRVPSPPQ